MKKMISIKNFFLTIVASTALVACGSDDNGGGSRYDNLNETANTNGLTTFTAAAQLAGVSEKLTGTQKYTLLAPTNGAFNEFLLENGYSSIDAIPVAILREVILNHLVAGDNQVSALTTGYKKTQAHSPSSSSSGLSLFINAESGVKLNGVSTITTSDIRASNGRIHLVDKVIPLATVFQHLQANPELSGFTAALQTYSSSQFAATLNGTGSTSPFTVVAPNNDGMNNILNTLDVAGYNAIPQADLQKILSYHILGSHNKQYSLITDGNYMTLAGQNFNVQNTGGGKKINDARGRVANFTGNTSRDIQTWNGIIHVIDNGLLPTF